MIRRTSIISLLMLLAAVPLMAEEWSVDNTHSTIRFTIRHLVVSSVAGSFSDFSGTLNWNGSRENLVDGSVERSTKSLLVSFKLTDYANQVKVSYTGILPDLFREGQGIIAQGKLDSSGVFQADEVLAKHDENYMPPEVAESLQHAKKNKVNANDT